MPRPERLSKPKWIHEELIKVKPKPNLEWRPQAKPNHSIGNPSPSNPSNSDLNLVLLTENALTPSAIDPVVAIAGHSGDIINRTWGMSFFSVPVG